MKQRLDKPGEVCDFNVAHLALQGALRDLRFLSGDEIGPSGVSWQHIEEALEINLRALLRYVEKARQGGTFVQFPSPDDTDD